MIGELLLPGAARYDKDSLLLAHVSVNVSVYVSVYVSVNVSVQASFRASHLVGGPLSHG